MNMSIYVHICYYTGQYLKCLNSWTPHQKKPPKLPITDITDMVFLHTDQEGAEEDEGDKVKVGKATSAVVPNGP